MSIKSCRTVLPQIASRFNDVHITHVITSKLSANLKNKHLSPQVQATSPFGTSHNRLLNPSRMSWMDSWSRPSKHQATPAPYYLLPSNESTPYCKSCGRVISARKSGAAAKASDTPVKYCSARCRNSKPGKLDREIEKTFVRFLKEEESLPPGARTERVKGDRRILVPCDVVQAHVFGDGADGEKGAPKKKDRTVRGEPQEDEQEQARDSGVDFDVDGEAIVDSSQADYDVIARMSIRSGTRVRPAQSISEVNGSVGGEKGRAERIEETQEMKDKRLQGQREVREREMVRSAARRGVVFGFVASEGPGADPGERVKCEAVMQGKVVEPSYAKGNWGVRWRE